MPPYILDILRREYLKIIDYVNSHTGRSELETRMDDTGFGIHPVRRNPPDFPLVVRVRNPTVNFEIYPIPRENIRDFDLWYRKKGTEEWRLSPANSR